MSMIGLWLVEKTGVKFLRFLPYIIVALGLIFAGLTIKWTIDGYWNNMDKLARSNSTLSIQHQQDAIAITEYRTSADLLLKQLQEERRLDKLFREGEAKERAAADAELKKQRANDLKRFDPKEQERAIKAKQLNPDEVLARENARTKCILSNWGDPDKCN